MPTHLPMSRRNPQPWRQKAACLGRACAAALLSLAALAARAAEPPALLTLLEGEATLIIGAKAYAAAPGARVPAGAMVETGTATGLLRLEWPDGTLLDLGPATRVMLRPPLGAGAGAAVGAGAAGVRFYLQRGWAKHSQPAAGGGQLAAAFEVAPAKGVLLSQVDEARAVLFAEAGGASFTPRRNGGTPATLAPGQAAVLPATGAAQILPRPDPAWLAQVPRAFRESLPPRAAQFGASPAPVLQPRPALGYADLQHWLGAEAALRRGLPARFAGLLADRGFRDAVNARLKQHPEWEPLLRPPRSASAARQDNRITNREPSR